MKRPLKVPIRGLQSFCLLSGDDGGGRKGEQVGETGSQLVRSVCRDVRLPVPTVICGYVSIADYTRYRISRGRFQTTHPELPTSSPRVGVGGLVGKVRSDR